MNEHRSVQLALGLSVAIAVLAVTAVVLSLFALDQAALPSTILACIAAGAAFGPIGALVVRRRGNAVGWALLAIGGSVAVSSVTVEYAIVSATHHDVLPAWRWVSWAGADSLVLTAGSLALLLLLYPTGGLPSRRWRPVLWGGGIGFVGVAVSAALNPVRFQFSESTAISYRNPAGIEALGGAISVLLAIFGVMAITAGILCIASLVIRFRRGSSDDRERIKWLAYVAVAGVVFLFIGEITQHGRRLRGQMRQHGVGGLLRGGPAGRTRCSGSGDPASRPLRHRGRDPQDGDRRGHRGLLRRDLRTGRGRGERPGPELQQHGAVVHRRRSRRGAVPADARSRPALRGPRRVRQARLAVRGARVVLRPDGGPRERRRARRDGSRRRGGHRREDRQRLAEAGRRPASVGQLARGRRRRPTGASGARRRHAVDRGRRRGTGSTRRRAPGSAGRLDAGGRARHRRDPAAAVGPRRTGRARAPQRAPHRGAPRITQASRHGARRGAAPAGAEHPRRRATTARRPHASVAAHARDGRQGSRGGEGSIAELSDTTQSALDDLRNLARGIYPPLLADQGLVVALGAQAKKSPVDVQVVADAIERYPQEIEAAVYFCSLEALQNIAKYAEASSVTIHLRGEDGALSFTVTDDGGGFDTTRTRYGTGLQGMADRLSALGGSLGRVVPARRRHDRHRPPARRVRRDDRRLTTRRFDMYNRLVP